MFKNQTVTITSSNNKWTTVTYQCSSAKSRIRTFRLYELITKKEITVTNPKRISVANISFV
ncbi:MAG: hypothetical protein KJO50_10930 [Bacteroidia bacterium]|nr:hypothetical protein [Bacteroidia bacterium]